MTWPPNESVSNDGRILASSFRHYDLSRMKGDSAEIPAKSPDEVQGSSQTNALPSHSIPLPDESTIPKSTWNLCEPSSLVAKN